MLSDFEVFCCVVVALAIYVAGFYFVYRIFKYIASDDEDDYELPIKPLPVVYMDCKNCGASGQVNKCSYCGGHLLKHFSPYYV